MSEVAISVFFPPENNRENGGQNNHEIPMKIRDRSNTKPWINNNQLKNHLIWSFSG